ncbi:TonB-dependent receptor [uncultured Draconibacterium sp.]|uniref:SusC/RagA family TonB-linked outer membrane protein n=1 Tax=uncultured Draconibacterium sp. TaxID=1573823 RepID=UPI00260078D2|nr:TonB-dependent receptor [uncultured Draconibacterium sp.]
MKIKKMIILILGLFVSSVLWAQEKSVNGKVTDEAGEALPGVNVVVKGTTTGTITQADGTFALQVPQNAQTLLISFIGFASQEVDISAATKVDVTLKADVIGLEEVVAVGYATQKKVNLTGSVASVEGETLAEKPVMNASMALQGVASGVTVTQNSGKPGGDQGTIRIRGIGTLGDSNPLVLVDGIQGDLNAVDPNEIETISILKDAASAAIYGSRAANGVILITTKRAKEGKLKVNYRGYAGWQEFTGLPKYADGYTYMELNNEAMINAGKTPIWSEEYMAEYKNNSGLYTGTYPDVNFQDLLFSEPGLQQHHNLTVAGGSGNLSSMASISYMDQEGLLPNYNYKNYSVRLNNDYKVSEKVQIKLDLFGRYSPRDEPRVDESSVFTNVNRLPALMAVYTTDGRYSTNFMNYGNPISGFYDGGNRDIDKYAFSGKFAVNVQPIEGMDVMFSYAPDFGYTYNRVDGKPVAMYHEGEEEVAMYSPSMSTLTERFDRYWRNNLNALVTYTKQIEQHNFTALAGYEQIDYKSNNFNAYRENFPFVDYMVLDNGSVINMNNGGTGYEWALRSYFGRLNYNFNEKYLVEANVRYDGSSRFSEGNKYGVFPSFSFGWRISEENFMSNVDWMDNLKFRASWGQLGNQNIGNYPFASVVSLGNDYIFNDTPVPGAALTDMANEDITWETTTTTNIGLDFGIFNKISGSFEWYVRNTDDILLQLPVPMTIGLTAPYQNAGKVKNTGWDFNVSYTNNDHEFKYSVGFVLSDVKNEVVDLKGSGPYIGNYTITQEGEAINSLFMYETDGLFQTQAEIDNHAKQFGSVAPGDIKYVDQITVDTDDDGVPDATDGVINADDRVVVGSNIPRYSYGIDLSAQYKGFDFSVFFQGVGKRDTYLDGYIGWAFYNLGNIEEWQMDRWTPENTDATYPRLIDGSSHNNFRPSDFWVYNSAYFRAKTLQFGYTLPKNLTSKIGLDKLRVYFSGNNLFTSSKLHDGWDPEQPQGNTSVYPITSTYVFGVDLNF